MRWLPLAVFFFLVACCSQIETLLIEPRSDAAAWLFMGAREAHGQMPGRDLWDNKLPLIYLIARAAMASGFPRLLLWLVEAGLTAAAATAVSALLQPADGSSASPTRRRNLLTPATAAGAMLCLVAGIPSFHAGGFKTEIYAMPLSTVAVLLSFRALRDVGKFWMGAVAGLLWAVAVSFRLPTAVVSLLLGGCALATIPAARRRRWLASHVLGLLFGAMLVLLHPIVAGYLPECLDAAVLWPAGLTGSHVPGPLAISTPKRLAEMGQDCLKIGWLYGPALWGLILAWRRSERSLAGLAGAWLLAAWASAAVGWASYAHYLYVSFAPACLACGLLLRHLSSLHARRLAGGLLCVAAMVVGFQTVKATWRYGPGKTDADLAATRQFLLRETAPTDSVFIWAWNRSAALLYELDRPPGNRHFLAHSYFDMDVRLFDEMVTGFVADPPLWIVEDARRNRPPLIASPNPPPFDPPPPCLALLQRFVRQNYDVVTASGSFSVLKRRDGPN